MDQIFREFGNTIADIFSSEIVQLALRGIGIYVVILWLATAFWAYQDMKSRTANPILPFFAAAFIVAFTPLFFVFAAIIYRIIRPHERVGEAHERMLAEEAMLAEVERLDHCLGCGRRIEEGWMVCPTCRARLRRVCPNCGKLVGADWILCAWCGVDFDRAASRPAAAGAYVAAGSRASRGPGRAQPQPQLQPQPYEPAVVPVAAAAYGSAQARPQAQPEVAAWPGAVPAEASVAERTTARAIPADPGPVATPMAVPMATPVAASSARSTTAQAEPAPRPAPAAPPSPFRSISDEVDADDLGSLVAEPPAAPAPSSSGASSSGASSSGASSSARSTRGAKPRTRSASPAPDETGAQASASASADAASDTGTPAPAPAPISGRRAAQR